MQQHTAGSHIDAHQRARGGQRQQQRRRRGSGGGCQDVVAELPRRTRVTDLQPCTLDVVGSQAAKEFQVDALTQTREQLTTVATTSAPQTLFVKPPTSDELAKNLNAALDQIAASKDVPADFAQAVNAARADLLADCDRGAAILADDGYRVVVHDTAVTEMLTEIDGWLAPESG